MLAAAGLGRKPTSNRRHLLLTQKPYYHLQPSNHIHSWPCKHTHMHTRPSSLSIAPYPLSPCNTHTHLHSKHKCCPFSNYTVHTISLSGVMAAGYLLYRTTVPSVISTFEIPTIVWMPCLHDVIPCHIDHKMYWLGCPG